MRLPTFLGEGDRYKIGAEIGRGGMGSVYRAEDKNTGKRVAIKIMIDGANPDAQELFEKESRILAELQHPNIIGITDKGDFREGGIRYPFFVMPYLKGQTLHERIHSQEDPLTAESTVAIISTVANSLQAAHERGVIHRDIKPTNIFVLESGPVVVIDFGVVHLSEGSSSTTVKGTTPYMAPELIDPSKNGNPSAASDLFSLGVVCYEALTGKHPFAKQTNRETVQAILHEIPTPAFELNQHLSLALSQVIQKSIAKDFRHRYSSVKEFADKLQRALRDEPLPEFDRQVIENKLRVVREALSRGQATSADELMRSIEEDGFIDPAISNQRQKIDQSLHQKWVREQIDSAKLYREANQVVAALEKLNELLRKAPGNVDAIRERDSILEEQHQQLVKEARSLMGRRLFAEARVVVQDATAIKPYDIQTTQLLDELAQLEKTDRELAERKAELYKEAQKAQREGHPATALRHLEQLMALIKQSSLSNPERDPIYKSFYEVVVEENNRLEQAIQTVRGYLSTGKASEAILLCEQMLAANPGNSTFEALRLEAENQEQQSQIEYVQLIRIEAEKVQDLNARVRMLQDAVERFPKESQLTGLLKSAKSKRDLVDGLLARARSAESPGRYTEALERWQEVRKYHASYPGIDEEIRRVEKLHEMENRADRRGGLVQEVAKLLRAGKYGEAAELSDAGLVEYPLDDELLAYNVEAKDGALLAPEVQGLVAEGRKLLQTGTTDGAEGVLRKAVKLDRYNQQARQLLGVVVLDKAKAALADGLLADATRLFTEVQSLIPEHPDVKKGLAQIRNQNRIETVEECLKAALRLSEAGDLNGALSKIDRSLQIHPRESRLVAESSRLRQLLLKASPAAETVLERGAGEFTSLSNNTVVSEKPDVRKSVPAASSDRPQDSKNFLKGLYENVLVRSKNLGDRVRGLWAIQVPALQTKWGELRPQYKAVYAISLIVVLAVAGFGVYKVSGRGGSGPVEPVTVSMNISTSPEGADISIDGQKAGVSEVRRELKFGDHEIEVSLAGYETQKVPITLRSDPSKPPNPSNHVVTLVPLPMELLIVVPANVKGKVTLDNEAKGDLAGLDGLVVPGVAPGPHSLRIEPDGRDPINATLDLVPGHPPKPTLKPAKEKDTFWFIGSFGGKLWAECFCPSGGKLMHGDVAMPIDPAGSEIDQPEGDQPLVFSVPNAKETSLVLGQSANPRAIISVSWSSAQTPKESPFVRVERLKGQSEAAFDRGQYKPALALAEQALKEASSVQRDSLNALISKIKRRIEIQ